MASSESGPPEFVPRTGVALGALSTLGVGGPARWFARAARLEDVRAAHDWASAHEVPLFVLGGGSNVVFADTGFAGLVLHLALRGMTIVERDGATFVNAAAGELWDRVVDAAVTRDLGGIECLSGIPGTVGGTPIQNVGAYGQEVSEVVDAVTAFDRSSGTFIELRRQDCGFAYRTSRFKTGEVGRFIVCGVTFRLRVQAPRVVYPDLVTELEREGLVRPEVLDVRRAVLAVRRRKGMVLDAADSDTRSVGSFFTNPVVSAADRDRIASKAGAMPPGFEAGQERVKIPAAWLIERSGFGKGFVDGAVGISSKHTLALVNRGGATARDVIRLASRVKRAVVDWWDVWLTPEPMFVGFEGDRDVEFLYEARG